jgi:hypothetical protein
MVFSDMEKFRTPSSRISEIVVGCPVGHRGPVYKGLGAMNPCDLSNLM